jgi:hypothetical protein
VIDSPNDFLRGEFCHVRTQQEWGHWFLSDTLGSENFCTRVLVSLLITHYGYLSWVYTQDKGQVLSLPGSLRGISGISVVVS